MDETQEFSTKNASARNGQCGFKNQPLGKPEESSPLDRGNLGISSPG